MILTSINCVNAFENNNTVTNDDNILETTNNEKLKDSSTDLADKIINANAGDKIIIEPGTYKLHNIEITKNLTLQGNGNPSDIIIDGENKSSIFLIKSDAVHASFKNITFINGLTLNFGGAISMENGLTLNFGGAISMETGHVYVDYCNFINNTALNNTNAGGISNYGTASERGYLFVNNSLFLNNHADHDGGAITTCYAYSYIYNSVFISNSARRDGGAIRVSVYGYGAVEDCIFMYNHADEWGGAYYSWASNSVINRCIFMNNTGGTNGGAVMVSGNITLTNSLIVNNTSNETGGSFYIQQPMFDAVTVINVHDNLITNNTSPLGKEIFIKWNATKLLFTKFNDNDWGDEDPTDPDVIDPNHVTKRSKVTSTKKSNLLNELNLDLLNRYSDILKDYFPKGYFDSDDNTPENNNQNSNENNNMNKGSNEKNDNNKRNIVEDNSQNTNQNIKANNSQNSNQNNMVTSTTSQYSENSIQVNGTSDIGSDSQKSKASEIIKHTPSKSISSINIGAIIFAIIAAIAFLIGYLKQRKANRL